ncbi:MAG TPA: hypothetical protein VEZ44_11450, partial [bacterium]|nr:hypothetical protein [bacterium]
SSRRSRPGTTAAVPSAPAAPDVTPAPPGGDAVPVLPAAGEGEEAWERTHLEQTMFDLARAHAADAERCAEGPTPDRQGERTKSLVAILMSYFALEAFISMVGGDRLGTRYRYYDRMTPEGKWVEVTRLASKTGNTFAENGSEMRALSTLRSWRNMLTHYKGEYEEVERSDRGNETRTDALLSAENAARAVEIARTMYRRFYEFDRRSAPRQLIWLDDRRHRPGRTASGAQPGEDAPHATRRGRARPAQPERAAGSGAGERATTGAEGARAAPADAGGPRENGVARRRRRGRRGGRGAR